MKVTLLSGVSGSGKSTYAKEKKFTERGRTEVISADIYFTQKGIYTYDASKIGEAHNACIRAFISICERPWFLENLIVDNTNTTAIELAPYVAIASAFGHEIELITFHADAVKCAERNIHGVSLETCLQMQANLNVRVLPSYWNITSETFNRV